VCVDLWLVGLQPFRYRTNTILFRLASAAVNQQFGKLRVSITIRSERRWKSGGKNERNQAALRVVAIEIIAARRFVYCAA
jgi:hypothetical protein